MAGKNPATKATQTAVTRFLLLCRGASRFSASGVPARRHSGSVLVTTVMGFKRIGFAFAALVVIGLGAIGVSSFLISTDTARDAVRAQIRAATGLDPTIQGSVSVSLFPPDTVTLRDVAQGHSVRRKQ